MVNALAPADASQAVRLLVLPVLGDQHQHRFAHGFLGGIAEQALRALVPALDDAVQILAQNGVIRGFHDGAEMALTALEPLAVGNVDQQIDGAGDSPLVIQQQ